MATTETSKLRTIAGVIGVGSLALFGATACDDSGTETEDPVENGEMEEEGGDMTEESPMEEEPMDEESTTEESPMEEESMDEDSMDEESMDEDSMDEEEDM